MTIEERSVLLDDGQSTTLAQWGTSGPVIVAVHGMTGSRRSWERLAAHLSRRFRFFAYDQRGHGDSAGVAGPMALARSLRDLDNVAAAIGEPIEALIGHSWGGAVVVKGGLRLPVARVAAIDPMIVQVSDEWYAEYVEELREAFAVTGAERDAATRAEYASRGYSAIDVEGKVHAMHAMRVEAIEGIMRENPPETWDLRPEIARYDKPLLLAMAAGDEGINDPAVIDDVIERHGPGVQIESFPGLGHNLHVTGFDRFAASLDAFLGG
jgi:pimeloyl-ACP methyl ester carboxylesterase